MPEHQVPADDADQSRSDYEDRLRNIFIDAHCVDCLVSDIYDRLTVLLDCFQIHRFVQQDIFENALKNDAMSAAGLVDCHREKAMKASMLLAQLLVAMEIFGEVGREFDIPKPSLDSFDAARQATQFCENVQHLNTCLEGEHNG